MRQWLLVILPAVALLGLGILVGVLINLGVNSGDGDEVTPSSVPAAAIGNAVRGEQLWMEKGYSICHSYGGQGGSDAPPLDYMRGDMSIEGIAGMSGTIWNHVPGMLPHFREEGIPFPTISPDEMADMIAYLHGGPTASD